jgi:RHS repeat-associated protein
VLLGPFGEPLRVSGTLGQSNPFQFSTKFTDNLSGLVYYGYRYYQPKTGRWLGRDPIQEQGGVNLYGFVTNRPMTAVDFLGLSSDEHLTQQEAANLKCAIQLWLRRAKQINMLFLWGADDYSLTIRFLKNYLNFGGDLQLPYSEVQDEFSVQNANDKARTAMFQAGQDSYLAGNVTFGRADLQTSLGRVLIYYSRLNPFEANARIHDRYTFQPGDSIEEGANLNVVLPGLSFIGSRCCWKKGDSISDKWMWDLELYGLAKSFWADVHWKVFHVRELDGPILP